MADSLLLRFCTYQHCLVACVDCSGVRSFLDVTEAIRELVGMAGFRQKPFTTSSQRSAAR